MKLILSSLDFRGEASKEVILSHLGMPIERCRVLFCPNEMANKGALRSKKYVERLKSYGFSEENVTVYNHYKPEEYKNLAIDAIYISGGNSFGTMEHLRRGSFDRAIVDYVRKGAVFIGGSAGAHLAGKSLWHVDRYDENAVGLTDLSGLGLYDGIFICHFCPERQAHLEELRAAGENVTALSNDNSLVVENGKATLF